MVDRRAIAYGIVVFPLSLAAALSHADPWVVLTGFPSGFVAGYRQRRLRTGLLYGCVTGGCIAALFLGGIFYLLVASDPKGVYPGVGFAIVGIVFIAILLLVESTVAGLFGCLLGR